MTASALSTPFIVSYVLLWLLVVVFGLLILLMFRQFGLAFMHPIDRAGMQGLDVGSAAPDFSLVDRQRSTHDIGFGQRARHRGSTVVVFGLPTCDICKGLATTVASLPGEHPDIRFVWVDGISGDATALAVVGAPGWISGAADQDAVHRKWEVSAVPFGFVVDPAGRISDKRVLNQRRDVEVALTA